MPTNEERREVAYNLRGNAQAHPDMSLILNVAFSDKGLKPDDGSMEYTVTSREAAMRLADLIEREPERTCRNVSTVGHNSSGRLFDFKCSECGAELCAEEMGNSPLWIDEEAEPISYCPSCGARVVVE